MYLTTSSRAKPYQFSHCDKNNARKDILTPKKLKHNENIPKYSESGQRMAWSINTTKLQLIWTMVSVEHKYYQIAVNLGNGWRGA